MKKSKKIGFLGLTIALLAAPLSSASFADSSITDSSIIVSEEGLGINVESPISQSNITLDNVLVRSSLRASSGYTNGKKRSVGGGKLWAQWENDGSDFRAVYTHNTKTHRCTAQNDTNDSDSYNGKYFKRSAWVSKGTTAYSPWIYQTLFGNKVFAATK
ncbi:hypothetical protein SDC9_128230 [bioreactor metagenome]|uniref:Bacteriocin n=1 Tax=bioreactor metagenome TaxID=1076179 RepID=A0A645CWF0_9ZZZZ